MEVKIKSSPQNDVSVGLDIGSFSIKAVLLDNFSENAKISSYGIERRISEEKESLSFQIEKLLKKMSSFPSSVNLSISGRDIIVRVVDFPKMKKQEMEDALSFEAEKYIPFDMDQVILDHMVIGESDQEGQVRVLLAAARKSTVNFFLKIAEDLGLEIGVIDSDMLAIFNVFSAFRTVSPTDEYAFIDLGHSQSGIILCRGTEPGLLRQIHMGADDIKRIVAKKLSLSDEQASEFIRGPVDEFPHEIKATIEPVLDALAREISLSLGYYENRYSSKIQKVFISGGLSYQDELVGILKEKLGFELKRWDPLENVELSSDISKERIDAVSSQLVISLGLALRG